jgi:tetratricopeptide (TPR) repeat protein
MKRILLLSLLICAACGGDPAERARAYTASGDDYAAKGQLNEAVIEYRNAAKADPNRVEVFVKLGRALRKLGRVPDAYAALSRAAELNPRDAATQLELASILIAEGDFQGARVRAEQALQSEPSNAEAHVLLGTALIGLEKLDVAVEQLERAMRIDPTHAGSFAALGSLRLFQGKKDEAATLLRKAAELDPKSARPHIALANFYWAVGDKARAEAELNEALKREPENRLAHRAAAMLYLVTGRAREAEPHLAALAATGMPRDRLALAEFKAAHGRRDEAKGDVALLLKNREPETQAAAHALNARLYLAATPPDPQAAVKEGRAAVTAMAQAPEAHYALGLALAATGQYDEADAAFAEVLRLEPRAAVAALERSRLSLARGDGRAAIETARAAASSPSGGAAASLQLARSLRATGRLIEARAELASLRASAGDSTEVQTEAAWLALASGERAAARAAFERLGVLEGLVAADLHDGHVDAARARVNPLLDAKPNDPSTLMLAARVELAAQDPDAAEPYLNRVLELDPRSLDAYYLLADIYRRRGNASRARAEFERALETRPDAAVPTRTMLGLIEQAEGNAAQAEQQYRAALARDSRAGVAANNLAWLLAERGEIDEARRLAETAVRELPGRPEAQHTLGWVMLKQGRPREAIRPLEASVRLAPDRAQYRDDLTRARREAAPKTKTDE